MTLWKASVEVNLSKKVISLKKYLMNKYDGF